MINKVILVGNVGADPEIRVLDGGTKMARFSLATTERIYNKEKNESKELTEWHNVVCWRGLADVVDRYVRKGSRLYVEGKINSREWEKDGVKQRSYDIVAHEIKMLNKVETQPQAATIDNTTPIAGLPRYSDEMPF